MSWPCGTSPPSLLPHEMMEVDTQPQERQDNCQHIRQQNADSTRVSLDLGKSSSVKQRRLRSKVWEDFEKYKDENGKDRARCNVCKKEFDGSSKSGTTHLKNHLESCQRKRNGGGGGDEPTNLAGSSSNPIAIKENPVMDQQLNHLDAARMIIRKGDFSLINSTNVGYIIAVYKEEKDKLRNYFEKLSCRLCLTICGKESYEDSHFCLMIWFIDDDWKLIKKIIGSKDLGYIDKTVIKEVINLLSELGIENNLSSVVVDDDNLFDAMIRFNEQEEWFSNQGSLIFKNKMLCVDSFFSQLTTTRIEIFGFLTTVFDSNFQKAIDEAIEDRGLLTGQVIPTPQEWWLKFRDGEESDRLAVLKNVLDLKKYVQVLLTAEQWDMLRVSYEYLKDTSDFDQEYSNLEYTANTYFPLLCRTYKLSKIIGKYDDFIFRSNLGIDEDTGSDYSIDIAEATWCQYNLVIAEDTWCQYNLVIAAAAVLDPRYKMDIVEDWYKEIFDNEWRSEFEKFVCYFHKVYEKYARDINKFKSCTSGLEDTSCSVSYKMLDHLGRLCKSSHVQSQYEELHLYLEGAKFPLVKDFDILGWWRFHAQYFPTLAKMARDFLSIQVSCGPFSFSIVGEPDYDDLDSDEELDIEEVYQNTYMWLAA